MIIKLFWWLYSIFCFCFSASLFQLGIFAENHSKNIYWFASCIISILIAVAGVLPLLDVIEEVKNLSKTKKMKIFIPLFATIWLITFFVCKFTFPSFFDGTDFRLP